MRLKVILIFLILILPAVLHSQESYYFTDGNNHYAKLILMKATDGTPIATLLTPNYNTFRYTGSGQGAMEFSTWTVSLSFSGPVFHYKDPRIYIDADLNWVETPVRRYNKRISKSEYERYQTKLPTTGYSNGVNGSGSSTYNHQNNTTTNSYTPVKCKYCGGGGGCSSCHGKGYKFNSYSGHNDTCPSCNGSGRCFNCYGSGRQR